VQADKDIPYTTLSIIMRTCGEAGFTKFRFAAKGQQRRRHRAQKRLHP